MKAEQLKAIRAKMGVSQAELARQLCVDRNTVNRWEMGIRAISPSVEKLIHLIVKNR